MTQDTVKQADLALDSLVKTCNSLNKIVDDSWREMIFIKDLDIMANKRDDNKKEGKK